MTTRGTILLTGFGPFPGHEKNVSAQQVTRLGNLVARRFSAHRVVARVLPTEWISAPEKLETIYAREQPKIALHFGVSSLADGFVLETVARNTTCKQQDACGTMPGSTRVVDRGPDMVAVTIPAREVTRRLKALGIPADLSNDAGSYICNSLLYHSLALAQSYESEAQVGLIHIPVNLPHNSHTQHAPGDVDQALDWETALTGGLEIVRACLGRPPSRRR